MSTLPPVASTRIFHDLPPFRSSNSILFYDYDNKRYIDIDKTEGDAHITVWSRFAYRLIASLFLIVRAPQSNGATNGDGDGDGRRGQSCLGRHPREARGELEREEGEDDFGC